MKIIYLVMGALATLSCSKPMRRVSSPLIVRDGLILPFEGCDFSKGEWDAKVTIDENDFPTMDPRVQRAQVLVCSEVLTLQEIQKSWSFRETDGDMATVTSKFELKRDGVAIFSAGIVLSNGSGGLQSEEFGWAPVVDKEAFYRCLSKFVPATSQ